MKVIVAVYDSKGEAYGRPIMELTKGSAIRAFESEINSKDAPGSKFPNDFSLWQLADYDERKGEILPLKQKINLSNAWEISNNSVSQGQRV